MRRKTLLILLVLVMMPDFAMAQTFSMIIKGGHIIDPKNNIDEVMDLAISNGKIALVAKNIDEKNGRKIIYARDMYVTPGLIDIHVHVYYGTQGGLMNGTTSVVPDAFSFRAGVTTFVDAGSSGFRTFPIFKKQTIDNSQTRVLAFLNIVGEGMRGGSYEQDVMDMNAHSASELAKKYPNLIVGFKLAHYTGHNWAPTDSTVQAGKLANLPVMIDFGVSEPPLSIEELFFKHLRPGDIFTHAYAYFPKTRETLVDENGKVKPFILEAQKRGIIFDVGHGSGSFRWRQAIPSFQQGIMADALSSDLHSGSMNSGFKDMTNLMSKFLCLGMPLQDVILRSTWNPAKIIRRPELGSLSVGSEADVAVFSLSKGDFGFLDISGERKKGTQKLVAELTIRAGRVLWDLNGISADE